MDPKYRLKKELSAWLTEHPADTGEFLLLISQSLAFYEEAQKSKRDNLALHAVEGLIALSYKSKTVDYRNCLDAAFHQCPTGPEGHCGMVQKFWNKFIVSCSNAKQSIDIEWIRNTRGEQCAEWWVKVVLPAIAAVKGQS